MNDKQEIDILREALVEQEDRHLEQINKLISIQVTFIEHTFDIIEKAVFSSEYTIKSIKYVGSTTAKWALKKIRHNVVNKLRVAQDIVVKHDT